MVNKLKIKYKQNVALFALEKKNTILFYKLSIFLSLTCHYIIQLKSMLTYSPCQNLTSIFHPLVMTDSLKFTRDAVSFITLINYIS